MANIMTGKIPDRPNHARLTDDLWKFTLQCLKSAPSDRPNAEQVLATLKEMDRSSGITPDIVGSRVQRNKTPSRELDWAHSLCINYSILSSPRPPSAQPNP